MRLRAGREVETGWRRPAARLLPALLVLTSGCTTSPPPAPSRASSASFFSVMLNTHDPATADLGFTAVDVTPSRLADVPATRRALVWLGGYDHRTCTLATSDEALRQEFATYHLAEDPQVLGYFVADEPNTNHNCPQSVGQLRARSALVHALDPDSRRFTLANVDDPTEFAAFKSTVDVLATNPYPCRIGRPCDSHLIPDRIASLRRAGVTRYVAMLQAFDGAPWRWPTARELQQMLDQWRRSDWCGAVVFSWTWGRGRLSDHPELLAVLREFNAHLPVPSRACS